MISLNLRETEASGLDSIRPGMSNAEKSRAAHEILSVLNEVTTYPQYKRPLGTSTPGCSYWSLEGMALRFIVLLKDVWEECKNDCRRWGMLCGK